MSNIIAAAAVSLGNVLWVGSYRAPKGEPRVDLGLGLLSLITAKHLTSSNQTLSHLFIATGVLNTAVGLGMAYKKGVTPLTSNMLYTAAAMIFIGAAIHSFI